MPVWLIVIIVAFCVVAVLDGLFMYCALRLQASDEYNSYRALYDFMNQPKVDIASGEGLDDTVTGE